MPALRNVPKPPARAVRLGSRILKGAPAGGGGAQPSVRSSSTYASTVSETAFSIALPAGWQPGDVCYIAVEARGTGATIGTPAGFTAVGPTFNPVGQTNTAMAVMRRVLQAGDTDPVAFSGASARFSAVAAAVQGADGTTPEDGVTPAEDAQSAATNSPVADSVTPIGASDLLLCFFGAGDPVTANLAMTFAAPAGMTLVAQAATAVTSPAAATDSGVMVASLALSSNAATGTQTATITPSSGTTACNSQTVALVVKPSGGGAPQAGPAIYPLGHPVQARRLPQRQSGRTWSRDGTYGQTGPPVRARSGPVQARIPQPRRGGSTRSTPPYVIPPCNYGAGTYGAGIYGTCLTRPRPLTAPVRAPAVPVPRGRIGRTARAAVAAVPQAGPPVYPLGHPVQARIPSPRRGGQVTRRAGTFGGLGPAVKALASAVSARLRVLPSRGRTAARSGVYAQLGPPVKPAAGPVRARRLPTRGGSAQGRTGTFTAVTLGAGPPIYPLGHPVQARRQLQRGGHVSRAAGAYGGTGAPVRPPDGPVRAQPAAARGGRPTTPAGTFTAGSPQAGPPVYPLGHPVQARRLPVRGGSANRRSGTYAGSGPPVRPLQRPVGIWRQQPPPPTRGRTGSARGPYAQTGPPVVRLRRPVRGQPQRPVLTGRADWRAGVYTAPFVVPFTVGALSASDAPGSLLTGGTASSALAGSTAASSTITAGDQRTGGPG